MAAYNQGEYEYEKYFSCMEEILYKKGYYC